MRLIWRVAILLLCIIVLGISTALAQDDATDEPTEVATEAPTEESTTEPAAATETPAPEATAESTPTEVPLAVDGSISMAGLIQTLAERYTTTSGNEFALEVRTNGPNAAFEAFCNGEIGLVMSTRYLTNEEETACANNNVEFIENLVAYQGVVFLLSPGVQTTLTCVSVAEMETVFGLGGEGTKFDVQKLAPEDAASQLEVYGPKAETRSYDILTGLMAGGEVRSDYTHYEDAATLVDTLSLGEAPGIAALSFAEYSALADTKGVTVLKVRNDETGDCIDPTLAAFETDTYEAVRPQVLYVSMSARQDAAIREFLTFVNNIETGAMPIAPEVGYTAASEPSYARSENNLVIPTTGRTFSRPTSPVVVSTLETGTVNFAGTAQGARLINTLTSNFTSEFTSATINSRFFGSDQAFEALCAGEADVVLADRTPSDDERAKCAEQNIEILESYVGTEALVFLVRADNAEIPQCVSIEELAQAFAAPLETAEETPNAEGREIPKGPANWNELNASYPDLPLTIFAPGASSLETGWLFAEAGQSSAFTRSNQEANVFYPPVNYADSNLYNAAAVANFEGAGLTVVYWNDYQNSEHKDALRPLQVGENCIAPDATTIGDGTYPFSAPLSLYFSKATMGQPIVGAFMWSLISEDTLEGVGELNLAVSNVEALRGQRDTFFALIEEAQAAFAEQQAAEATAEATADANATADPNATAEATQAATAEASD